MSFENAFSDIDAGRVSKVEEDNEAQGNSKNSFIRSKKDNTLFVDYQVSNIKHLVADDCENVIDSDSIAYKCASSVEEDYVQVDQLVVDEKDKLSVPKGITFKNKTEFKGGARTVGKITPDSYLGTLNIKRVAAGLAEFTLDDFEITPKKKLKFENGATIDGKKFKNSEEVVKYYIDEWISAIKVQTQIDKVLCVLGAGQVHRHFLKLPVRYKEARVGTERPILLDVARNHILDTYPSLMAKEGFEADEVVDALVFESYIKHRKTGQKMDKIKSSIDKDARANGAGIVFDYTKDFHFKYPQPWMFHSSDRDIGMLELVKGEVKGLGLIFLIYQVVMQDSADGYGSRLHLPKELKEGIRYGDTQFYTDFVNIKDPQEALQKAVDLFGEWFTHGVQYTAWDGTEIDEDTLWWMQQCFACAYMTRSYNDKTVLVNLLDRFKVDYSKLVGNNKTCKPVEEFNSEAAESIINTVEANQERALTEILNAYKSCNKGDLVLKLDSIKELFLSQKDYIAENKTIMVEKVKPTKENTNDE